MSVDGSSSSILTIKRHARPATPTCPAGGFVLDDNTFFLSSIYPAGFTPRFVGVTDQIFGTVGVKGSNGAIPVGPVDLAGPQQARLCRCTIRSALHTGRMSQTSFEFGKQIQKEWNVNLDVAYELQAGLASPITLSGRRGIPQGNLQDDRR